MTEINQHVRNMRILDRVERHRYLAALIAKPTDDAGELAFRALLMTALNEAMVWPPRGSGVVV